MLSRIAGIIADLRSNPPPLPVDEIAEAIQFLEWIADDNFTLLGARDYSFTRKRRRARSVVRDRARPVALARRAAVAALEPAVDHHAGNPRVPRRAEAAHRHQGDDSLARAPARLSRLHRHQALRSRRQARRRTPVLRPVHLDRLYAPGPRHSLSAAQDRQRHPPRRLRSVEPFRQGAGQCARNLSARRAVSDRRGHALSVRARHPAARRAAARTRAAAARSLRPLRVGPRLCAARPLRQPESGRRSAIIWLRPSTAASAPIIRSSRKGRWCAFISSSAAIAARRQTRIARRSIARSRRSCAAGPTVCARRSVPAPIRRADGRLFARYRDAFPIDYREVYPPPTALADIGVIETLTPERPLGVEFYRAGARAARKAPASKCSATTGRSRCRSACRCWRIWASASSTSAPITSQPKDRDPVWFHDMTLESALGRDFDLAALKDRLEACFLVVMGKKAESDGYNALVLANGLGWRDVALIRTISRFLRQVRVPFSQDYMWTTLRKYSGLAAQIVALFQTRFDPRLAISPDERSAREAAIAADNRNRVAGGREPRRGPHPAPLRQRGHAPQSAPISIRSAATARQGAYRHQIFEPQGRRHAAAAAALRNLRLFAAGRSGASALRQSGARRHSLVRPAAGFPHRNPRPRQSAERQERGDRAGRRQGRLRAEISAGRAARARPSRPKASPPTNCSSRRCSTSPTISAPERPA